MCLFSNSENLSSSHIDIKYQMFVSVDISFWKFCDLCGVAVAVIIVLFQIFNVDHNFEKSCRKVFNLNIPVYISKKINLPKHKSHLPYCLNILFVYFCFKFIAEVLSKAKTLHNDKHIDMYSWVKRFLPFLITLDCILFNTFALLLPLTF